MSIFEAAQKIMESGFDPKKDKASSFDNLPEGEYDVILKDVEWRTNDSGFEWLSLQFEVLNEGFEGRLYFGMINYTNEFFLEENIKKTIIIGALSGVEITPEDFIEPETSIIDALKPNIGAEMMLTLTDYVSKKGKPGQNFDVSEAVPFE